MAITAHSCLSEAAEYVRRAGALMDLAASLDEVAGEELTRNDHFSAISAGLGDEIADLADILTKEIV